MSTTEIRATLDRLSPEDRFYAAAYLHHVSQAEDPAWQQETEAAQAAMDAGRKVTLAQVRALHESLAAQGL
jgi:hypothetical protein